MKKVRFGVIGLGNMGSAHAPWCARDGGRDVCLGAVCDIVEEKAARFGRELKVPHFADAAAMMDSGLIDAVIIATPHYWHGPLAIGAARRKLHVLCEKPLESRVGVARAMVAECRKNRVALGVVLHHRTRAIMRRMKQLVAGGAVGEVFRVEMICSSWFRTQAYYDSGAWRGTWDGEGGGVLINQAPHHLDLFQWIGGMPKRILGMVHTRAHRIEVEDTANFLCDYGAGKVGYLYATTAEEPGMEQFTVCGDEGTVVCKGGKLMLGKLKQPVSRHIFGARKAWPGAGEQKCTWKEVKLPQDPGGRHLMIIRAFAAHVLRGSEMYATGEDGLNELELSNAMYIAGFKNKAVELPVDAAEIDRLILQLEKQRSTGRGGGLRAAADREMKRLMRAK
jgi:predicted dehydrogenase